MMDNFKYHLKRILPFIVTILLILLLPAYIFLKKNGFVFFEKKVRKVELLWEHQDSVRVADSLKRINIKSKVPVDKLQDTLVKPVKAENPSRTAETRGTYFIIAGCFANTENARLAAGKYRSRGYKTSIISMTDRNGIKAELVSVKTFNNFSEASRYLREFQSKFDPKAWIYTKK
jgi:hypothetical protein